MEKIVNKARIIDLHIHSYMSKHKDAEKVSENTIENLDVLTRRLNKNKVNICSITDHDVFSHKLYKELKKQEGIGEIEKVLPGVEFSVLFEQNMFNNESVHVVAIFDDTNDERVEKIESILNYVKGDCSVSPKYDQSNNYSEVKFIDILREIGLDVILIAHQKSSPKGTSSNKNDLLRVTEKYDELLFTCYFDALEFRNRNNEIFNRAFIKEKGLDSKIGFITGTDCHSWSDYPFMYKGDLIHNSLEEQHIFTYAKCLPTFKGLTMCFTDYSRFQYECKFFSSSNSYIASMDIAIDGEEYKVPLSKGINVIIGDNSVGKSFLLYELLGDMYKDKYLKKDQKNGYKKYALNHNIKIAKTIDSSNVFMFDPQGEIRKKFENRLFKDDDFLSSFFQEDVNTDAYKVKLENELKILLEVIDKSDKNIKVYTNLASVDFSISETGNTSFNFSEIPQFRNSKKLEYKKVVDWINLVAITLQGRKDVVLNPEETNYFDEIDSYLKKLSEKYSGIYNCEILQDEVYSIVKSHFTNMKNDLTAAGTEYQREISRIDSELGNTKNSIVSLVRYKLGTKEYKPNISKSVILPNVNKNNYYNFVSATGIATIDSKYFWDAYCRVFKKDKVVNPINTTYAEIEDNVSYIQEGKKGIQHLKDKMNAQFEEDLKPKYIINPVSKNEDVRRELSTGMNQRSYFDIIAGEMNKKGIYIIDQPEDGVAQKAINQFVLKNFKEMSKNRQIIMVTHNPQFIINLDVDNVVYIEKNENTDQLLIKSGALEYFDDGYSILDIISENIEGGIESLRKRWKRYGKEY